MADLKFLKKPEFWITTFIAVILTFVGGFFAGNKYTLNEPFSQQHLFLENSTANQQSIGGDASNSIVTQNQRGDNILVVPEKPPRTMNPELEKQIDGLLENYSKKEIVVEYLMGNGEAYDFANSLTKYLQSQGRYPDLQGIMTTGKLEGQQFFFNDDGILVFAIGEQ